MHFKVHSFEKYKIYTDRGSIVFDMYVRPAEAGTKAVCLFGKKTIYLAFSSDYRFLRQSFLQVYGKKSLILTFCLPRSFLRLTKHRARYARDKVEKVLKRRLSIITRKLTFASENTNGQRARDRTC